LLIPLLLLCLPLVVLVLLLLIPLLLLCLPLVVLVLLLLGVLLRLWLALPVAFLLILREGWSSHSKRQGQNGRSDDEFRIHTRFLDLHWLTAACSGASFPWSNGLEWRWLQPM
jgi:hypothetical protein